MVTNGNLTDDWLSSLVSSSFSPLLSLQIEEAQSLDELREVMAASWEYLELAGCSRPISSLEERPALVEDLVSFTLITRMQLPLQRWRRRHSDVVII